ncbi:hypothetical protein METBISCDRAFT_29007, partial [Metschnikowia bicuspidata]
MKQDSFGPAMAWPIFSTLVSPVARAGCAAQSYLSKAAHPFLRCPYAQFLDKNDDEYDDNCGKHPAFPFLNASGGFLLFVHGLVGLRFDYDVHARTVQRFLHVDPAVPATFPSGMYLSGLRAGLQVTNLGPIAGAVAANTTLHVNTGEILSVQSFYIAAGETHTLPVCVVPPQSQYSLCECGRARFANMTAG